MASYHVIVFRSYFQYPKITRDQRKINLNNWFIDIDTKMKSLSPTGGLNIVIRLESAKLRLAGCWASSRVVDLSKWTKRGFTQISPGVISRPLPNKEKLGDITKTQKLGLQMNQKGSVEKFKLGIRNVSRWIKMWIKRESVDSISPRSKSRRKHPSKSAT